LGTLYEKDVLAINGRILWVAYLGCCLARSKALEIKVDNELEPEIYVTLQPLETRHRKRGDLPLANLVTMISLVSMLLISNAFSAASTLPQNDLSLQQSTPTLEPSQQTHQHNLLTARSTKMDQTIASFTDQGLCFHYFAERPPSHPNPCIEYCNNHGGHGYSGVSTPSPFP
jgi:hypothetical protein